MNPSSSTPAAASPLDHATITYTHAPAPPLDNVKGKCRPIVLCFDGTGKDLNANTNVIKLFNALEKGTEETDQLSLYQSGIGTSNAPGARDIPLMYRWFAWKLDKVFASNLRKHVLHGYTYLVDHYKTGDKICIFGFSRGAYTARALAGMLRKVGLLQSGHKLYVEEAFNLYKSTDLRSENKLRTFRQSFCYDAEIDFVGVWDTVTSVGLFGARSLPLVDEENATIRILRHAVALDEHRAKFRPNLCAPSHNSENTSGMDESGQPRIREVWFVGSHSDIGGGKNGLSDITLRWMMNEAVLTRCPILFTEDAKREWHILAHNDPPAQSGGNPAQVQGTGQHDAQDVEQEISDRLKKSPGWWILEGLPMPYTYRNDQRELVTTWRPHFGRGRQVPQNALFHASVRTRMDNEDLNYRPRARYREDTVVYVNQ